MYIPEGVNYLSFYQEAKKKGIKITSRYPGVILNVNAEAPSWMARYQGEEGFVFLGRFPFTKDGEDDAGKKYLQHLESIDKDLRYAEKRKYKR